MTARSRVVSRYSLAVLAVLLAALLHAALDPVWGGRIPFVAFYPAVVFVAWFAGMGPGLLATVLSALLITRAWLVTPSVSAEGHVVALAFFVSAGVTVSFLVAARAGAREGVDRLLRHTPLGLAIHDADFRYVRVNRALAEMNGLAPGAHRGRTVREVLGDAATDLLEPLLQRVHTTRRPVTVDSLRVPLSDGPSEKGERYFSLIYSPILDGRGRVTGSTASVVEVTARVRAEQALDHERELLQTIIDTIPAMITMFTPDTRVLRLNREFERVTGWTAAEAQRVDFMAACYPDSEYRAMVRRHMEAPEPGWLDLNMTTKGGGVVQTSWSNVRLSDGSRVGIGLDITERKAHEAELMAARAAAERANRAARRGHPARGGRHRASRRLGRRPPGVGHRGRHAAGAGRHQSRQQCAQVHARRGHHPRLDRRRGRRGPAPRERQRRGHEPRAAAAHLRPLRAGRSAAGAGLGRPRHRPHAGPPARRASRRPPRSPPRGPGAGQRARG